MHLLLITVGLIIRCTIALTVSIEPVETTDVVIVGPGCSTTPSSYVSPVSSSVSGPGEGTQLSKSTTASTPTTTGAYSTLPISSTTPPTSSSLVFSYSTTPSLGNSTTRFVLTGTGSLTSATNQCVCTASLPPLTSNDTAATDDWTGPDWDSYPTSVPPFPPLPGPQPTARPYTDPEVVELVEITQNWAINEYNLYGVVSCFLQGATTQCESPWIFGTSWNNATLGQRLMASTESDSSYYCSSDQTYLSDEQRFFYGFSQSNLTDSLQGVAHSASLYATTACLYNDSCALTYQNDTSQMYQDFRGYINATFFDTLTSLLPQNDSVLYCPVGVAGSASMFTIPTTPFQGDLQYFGLHNAIFIPGMVDTINGSIEQGKKELGEILANNARRVEGTFLNMLFFSYDDTSSLSKRSEEDEVYPNCTRRDWVIDGCKGVIPPREFDLAGTVVPMKDRDKEEFVFRHGRNYTTDLIARDAGSDQCSSTENSIQNSINQFIKADQVLNVAAVGLAALPPVISAILAAEVLGAPTIVLLLIAALGLANLQLLVSVASCEAFNTCNGMNPGLVAAANAAFGNQEVAGSVDALLELIGGTAWALARNPQLALEGLQAVTQAAAFEAALTGAAVAIVASVAYIGLLEAKTYLETLLTAAVTNYQNALACCAVDCSSAVCQQAGAMCLDDWGNFWSGGSIGTNCGLQ